MSEKNEITAKDVRDGVLAALKKAIDTTAGTIFGNNQKEENGLQKMAKADSEFDTPAELDSAIRKYYDASRKFKLAIPKRPKGLSGSSKAIFGGAPAAGAGDSKGAPVAKAEVSTDNNACVKCEKGEIASLSLSKTSMESLKLDKSFEHGLCKSCGASYKRQALVNKNDKNITSDSPWDLEKALQEDYAEVPMNGVVIAKKKPGAKLPPEKSEDLGNTDEGEVKGESIEKGAISDAVAATREKLKGKLSNLSEGEARRAGFPGVPKDAKDTNTKPSTETVQKTDGIPSAPKAPAPTNLNKQSLTTPPTGVQPASQNKLPV